MNVKDRICLYVAEYRGQYFAGPSIREIARHLDYKSPAPVHDMVQELVDEGRLGKSAKAGSLHVRNRTPVTT